MAFTPAVSNKNEVFGGRRVAYGTFVNDGGSVGGNITPGLSHVSEFIIQETGAAVIANRSVVNETLPKSGDATTLTIAIVTDANVSGQWFAFGR